MSKKTFYLLITAFIILGAVWGVWFFRQRSQVPTGTSVPLSLRDFFPFGKNTTDIAPRTKGNTSPSSDTTEGEQPPATAVTLPKLRKISSMPIAGATIFEKERPLPEPVAGALNDPNTATTDIPGVAVPPTTKTNKKTKVVVPPKPTTELISTVRYVEKERGHVYESYLDTLSENKISNTTIPRIHEAFFGNDGQNMLLRYLDDDGKTIDTFAASLPTNVTSTDGTFPELKGYFMPANISDLSLAPDLKSLFYLMPYSQSAIGTVALLGGSQKVQIFNSEFTEWLSQWPAIRTILLTTKPSYVFPGSAYIVDTQTRSFDNVLSEINGLTTLMSPNGKSILYSESTDGGVKLKLFKMDTREFIDIGIKTLPEKCVWGADSTYAYCAIPQSLPEANYPDNWYQGLLSFNDDTWKLDFKSNIFTIIAHPEDMAGESIDATHLTLDSKENYLIFTNKKDSFLWSLNLK